MTITAMVTTVALLTTAGIAAWQVGQMGSRAPAANSSLAGRVTGRARPAHSRCPAPTPSRAAASPAGPPARQGAVTVTPAAAVQPNVHPVVGLLDSYFAAINQHDFPAYSSLFIPAIRATMHNFGPGIPIHPGLPGQADRAGPHRPGRARRHGDLRQPARTRPTARTTPRATGGASPCS